MICRDSFSVLLTQSRSTRRIARWMLAAAGCLTLCATAAAKDKVPDWVREAASTTLATYPPKTEAVVLLYEITYGVNAQGRTSEHVREVVKLLRPQARREYETVGAWYDNSSKLESMSAWSIAPTGQEFQANKNDISDHDAGQGFELYSDDRYRSITVPAVDTGTVVAWEFERTSNHPLYTDYIFHAQRNIPVVKERLTLEMPTGFTYQAVWKGQTRSQAVDLEHGRTLWELRNVPGVDMEDVPFAPSARSLESRLDIHYTGPGLPMSTGGSWSGIGEWYQQIAEGTNAPNSAIRAKATELVAGKTDFADKVQALAEYVQKNIRYVAIEVGIGGYQPHNAADIYTHQYGDCKDKATLLSALLEAAGIHGTWLMVDTRRGVVEPSSPSLAGNHMIAAIELPDGYTSPKLYSVVKASTGKRYLIFDPTWENTPFGQLETELQGGYGILMEGKNTEAIALPVLSPETNIRSRTAHFQLAADGSLSGDVLEKESGDLASGHRELYTHWTGDQQTQYLHRRLARDLTDFHMTDLKVANAASLLQDLTVSYTLQAPGYSHAMGPLLMVRPRVLGNAGFRLDHKQREVPIDLGNTAVLKDEFDIALPKGYAVDEVPPHIDMDLGFATYTSVTESKDGTLHYKRTLTINKITLPANRYDDLKKLAAVIEADEQGTAILKKQ